MAGIQQITLNGTTYDIYGSQYRYVLSLPYTYTWIQTYNASEDPITILDTLTGTTVSMSDAITLYEDCPEKFVFLAGNSALADVDFNYNAGDIILYPSGDGWYENGFFGFVVKVDPEINKFSIIGSKYLTAQVPYVETPYGSTAGTLNFFPHDVQGAYAGGTLIYGHGGFA